MPLARASIGRKDEIDVYYRFGIETPIPPIKEPEPDLYLRIYGIQHDRTIYGNAIMLLGKAFRDGGLPFGSTPEALDALLGTKKPPVKSKKVA
jgi:hypothetical protein